MDRSEENQKSDSPNGPASRNPYPGLKPTEVVKQGAAAWKKLHADKRNKYIVQDKVPTVDDKTVGIRDIEIDTNLAALFDLGFVGGLLLPQTLEIEFVCQKKVNSLVNELALTKTHAASEATSGIASTSE